MIQQYRALEWVARLVHVCKWNAIASNGLSEGFVAKAICVIGCFVFFGREGAVRHALSCVNMFSIRVG